MNDFNKPNHEHNTQNLQVWHCEGCRAIHFKTGNVMLNFTKTEFAELTQVIMEIYQQQFGGLEFYRLINLLDQKEDEVLLSQTIA